MSEVELVADHDFRLGEGPLWHPDEERLFWLDIVEGRVYGYDPDRGESGLQHEADRKIGGFTLQESGSLLLFMSEGRVEEWTPGTSTTRTVVEAIAEERDTRFNDVIADPEGRVICGTLPTGDRPGNLYRLETDGEVTLVDEGWDIPNGMGFSPDRSTFYATESQAFTIHAFDYERATGELSNRRAFVSTDDEAGEPDGMTVDEAGHVWSARWEGGFIARYDPDGRAVERVEMPVPKPTSVTFGGPDYGTMYVSSAKGYDAEDDPPAGSLFRLEPDVAGVPEFRSSVSID